MEDKLEHHSCDTSNVIPFMSLRFLQRMTNRAAHISRRSEKLIGGNFLPFNVFHFDFSACPSELDCGHSMLVALGVKINKANYDPKMRSFVQKCGDKVSALMEYLNVVNVWTYKVVNEVENPVNNATNSVTVSNIGVTFHPLELAFNQSCHPNLQAVTFEDQRVTAWIVNFPVKAGEQLFIQYRTGFEWHRRNKEERQKRCKEQYKFECSCEACVGDWKLENVANYRPIEEKISENICNAVEALQRYRKNCKYINDNYKKGIPRGKIEEK